MADVPLKALKGLGADVVLNAAGIRGGRLRGDAQVDQPLGEETVALIDPLGVGLALLRQFQMAVLFHGDVTVGFQNGHSARKMYFARQGVRCYNTFVY